MVIYYSMIGWIIFVWVLSKFMTSSAYYYSENGLRVRKGFALFTMAYIIFFVGMRNSVGDTPAYIKMFNDFPSTINFDFIELYQKDRGFFLLSTLFKKYIWNHYNAWFMLIAIICGGAIVITLYKYSENFFFSMFLFMTMAHFVWMINGMRQFIAVCLIFANIKLIEERKFVKYLLLTLILSTIHITALIMIPAYYIAIAKPWGKKFWLAIAIMLVLGFSIDAIAEQYSYILEDSAYEGYLIAAAESAGSNILRTLVAFAPVALAFVCRKYTKVENNFIINASVNFSCVSTVLYLCSSKAGGILIGRLPIYFDIFNLILLPWLVEKCFTRKSKTIIYLLLILCYLMFFYSKVKLGMRMGYSSQLLRISY